MVKNSGWAGVAILSALPAVIWVSMQPVAGRFSDPITILGSMGQIFGLLGMAIFSLNLVLSGRFRALENYFGGMNRIYIAHHIMGGAAFVLLMFHPLFLAARLVPSSVRNAALFLFPGDNLVINAGIAALASMMVLLVITFFVKLPYQRWRLSHKFLAAAFFFGLVHMFLIQSDVAASFPLRVYMFSLAGLGVASVSYRVLLHPVLVRKYDYSVDGVDELGKDVLEVSLKPAGPTEQAGKKMQFIPGQFAFISFRECVSQEAHPFSMSSSPSEGNLRFGIKKLGDFTGELANLKKGCAVKIEGPFGRFCHSLFGREQIWIAGGIGMTPFMSMARSLKNDGESDDYKIDLYYCVTKEDEAVFLKELQKISAARKNLRIIPFYSEKEGRITGEKVESKSGPVKGKTILICGPPPMMKSLKAQFRALSVPDGSIRTEEFALL